MLRRRILLSLLVLGLALPVGLWAVPGDWTACFPLAAGGCAKVGDLQVTGTLNAPTQSSGTTALVIGGATTPSVTITTDGTGNGELVVPTGSIGTTEILDATITTTDISATAGILGSQLDSAAGIVSGQILDGTLVDADLNTTAAITQSKLDRSATLASNPASGASTAIFGTLGLIFEGATSDTNEGLLSAADVTADRTWTLPDTTGMVVTSGAALNIVFCGQGANATTFYLASSTAPSGGKVLTNARDLGDATCDARGSTTEATADEVISRDVAYRVLGMDCWTETTPAATRTLTARSAAANLSPSLSCTMASGGPTTCRAVATGDTVIAAGATAAVQDVTTTNESAVGVLCVLSLVAN